MARAHDGIVLDLDDTLIDTSRLLVPEADRRAALAMIPHGAEDDVPELTERFRALRAIGATDVFRRVADEQGLRASNAADAAEAAFFRYEVPDLVLEPEVSATLDELSSRAPLALLTFGDPDTQRSKIERLGLARWFAVVEIVARGAPEGKPVVLARLIAAQNWRADRVVVCGDNPASDMRAGNACGCATVLVRRPGAEFANAAVTDPSDRPDHVIASITELPRLLDRL